MEEEEAVATERDEKEEETSLFPRTFFSLSHRFPPPPPKKVFRTQKKNRTEKIKINLQIVEKNMVNYAQFEK